MQNPVEASSPTRDWVIYKITNPKGRVYIGKTVNFKKRKSSYKSDNAKNQPVLRNSFIKYGFENHHFEIIDRFHGTEPHSSGREMFWIKTYMSFCKDYPEQDGMNLSRGGKGAIGAVRSAETREKMRVLATGRKASDAQKLAASLTHRGHKRSYGKKQSEETIRRKIAATKGKPRSEKIRAKLAENNRKRLSVPVIQYDLNGNFIAEYPSSMEAEKHVPLNRNMISAIAKGKRGISKKGPGKWFDFKFKQDAVKC